MIARNTQSESALCPEKSAPMTTVQRMTKLKRRRKNMAPLDNGARAELMASDMGEIT